MHFHPLLFPQHGIYTTLAATLPRAHDMSCEVSEMKVLAPSLIPFSLHLYQTPHPLPPHPPTTHHTQTNESGALTSSGPPIPPYSDQCNRFVTHDQQNKNSRNGDIVEGGGAVSLPLHLPLFPFRSQIGFSHLFFVFTFDEQFFITNTIRRGQCKALKGESVTERLLPSGS